MVVLTNRMPEFIRMLKEISYRAQRTPREAKKIAEFFNGNHFPVLI